MKFVSHVIWPKAVWQHWMYFSFKSESGSPRSHLIVSRTKGRVLKWSPSLKHSRLEGLSNRQSENQLFSTVFASFLSYPQMDLRPLWIVSGQCSSLNLPASAPILQGSICPAYKGCFSPIFLLIILCTLLRLPSYESPSSPDFDSSIMLSAFSISLLPWSTQLPAGPSLFKDPLFSTYVKQLYFLRMSVLQLSTLGRWSTVLCLTPKCQAPMASSTFPQIYHHHWWPKTVDFVFAVNCLFFLKP